MIGAHIVANTQGLAEFYDRQSPQSREECADAVKTLQKLLPIVSRQVILYRALQCRLWFIMEIWPFSFAITSDPVKKHTTVHKLASLYRELGEQDKVGRL